MMRGVRKRLPDLGRDLVDRPLALGQHVDDLGPAAISERLGHRSERVEQRVFSVSLAHILKLSFEYTNVNVYPCGVAVGSRRQSRLLQRIPGESRVGELGSAREARGTPGPQVDEEDLMAGVHVSDFDSPDEVRSPDKTVVHIVRMGETATAARMTLQPGWRWSECIKPVAGTDSCQVRHVGLVQSGTLRIAHNDGTQADATVGQSYVIEPGHDAWVVGDEPFVAYEFETKAAEEYARTPG
jgi:hypothetical protein